MKRKFSIFILLIVFSFSSIYAIPQGQNVSAASAGLAYGPKYVGNIKLYVTNVHNGWAGPKFPSKNTPHINVHIDKKNSSGIWKAKHNFHVVKYTQGSKLCLYIYDTTTKKTVMDSCQTNWLTLSNLGAKAMKTFAKVDLNFTDQTSLFIVFAVVPYLVYKLLTGKLLLRPASLNQVTTEELSEEYIESFYVTENQPINNISGFDPSLEIDSETIGGTEVQTTAEDEFPDITELPTIDLEVYNKINNIPPYIPIYTDPTIKY